MAALVELLQPVTAEYTGIRGFGDRGLLQELHLELVFLQEAADHNSSRLVAERCHLEVKVAWLKKSRADGSEMNDDLVPQAERPALAEEQSAGVLSLPRRSTRTQQQQTLILEWGCKGLGIF